MDWSIGLRQRDKVAIALGVIFFVIVGANWFMNYSMEQVSSNFNSVYKDRLVPALDISAIVERSYENHLLLEEHILASDKAKKGELYEQIDRNQRQIDSILVKFEKTYLTADERQSLENYKQARQDLLVVQNVILSQSRNMNTSEAKNSFNTSGNTSFQLLLIPLHDLSKIQGTIGHELLSSAERQMHFIKLLTTIVIAMAVIIAVLVATLLQTSRKLNAVKQQKFNLN